MIEHRPAGGGVADWHPTPSELPLEAIKALGRRMERSSSITPAEADQIVREHGGWLPASSDNPSIMVKLLKVARAERRSRGVDSGPAAPKEFRRRRITTDAEADAYVERTRHLRRNPEGRFTPPGPLVYDALKKTRPRISDTASFRAFDSKFDRWCDAYQNACRRR